MTYTVTVYGPAFSYRDDGYIRFFDQAGRPERRAANFPGSSSDWLVTSERIDVGRSSEPDWPVGAEDLLADIRELLAQPQAEQVEAVHISPLFGCILWLQGVLGERHVNMRGIRRTEHCLYLADSIEVDGRRLEVVVDNSLDGQTVITGHAPDGTEIVRFSYA